jgi:hypothetical protein
MLRTSAFLFTLTVVSTCAAQEHAAHPLADYVDTCAYGPGKTIEIVAADQLFAVLDGAKYRLSRAGIDVFANPG